MESLRRRLLATGSTPSKVEIVGFAAICVCLILILQDVAMERAAPRDTSHDALEASEFAQHAARSRIRTQSRDHAVAVSRTKRQASSNLQAHPCRPLPSGTRLLSALQSVDVNTPAQCHSFIAMFNANIMQHMSETRPRVCNLANSTCQLARMVQDFEASSGDNAMNATTDAGSICNELFNPTCSACGPFCDPSVSCSNAVDFASPFSVLDAACASVSSLARVGAHLAALTELAMNASLADLHASLQREQTNLSAVVPALPTLLDYDVAVETLQGSLNLSLSFCTVAFPVCVGGQPVPTFGPLDLGCRRTRVIQSAFYPSTYPVVPTFTPGLVPDIFADQCLDAGRTQETISCFRPDNTTSGGPTAIFTCPDPFQTTDDPSHWLPLFEQSAAGLSDLVSPPGSVFINTSFPCGQKCRAEGYEESTAQALLIVQSIGVYLGILASIVAVVVGILSRETMFTYPNRLLLYLNVAYMFWAAGYLPAATVDTIPLLCHSDRTLRTENLTDSSVCVYSFIMQYGFGLVLVSVHLLVAFSWCRLAYCLRQIAPLDQTGKKQLALEMSFIAAGVIAGIVGCTVLLMKDDGIQLIIQNGICAPSNKYSLYATEIPFYVGATLEIVLLAIGMFNVYAVRRRSLLFRRASRPHAKRNNIRKSLNRIIRTLMFYTCLLAVTTIAWGLVTLAIRIEGIDPSELFDQFEVFTCSIVTCGASICTPVRASDHVVAGDFIFAILIGLSGVVYASWVLQRSIWQPESSKKPRPGLKTLTHVIMRMTPGNRHRSATSSSSYADTNVTVFSTIDEAEARARVGSIMSRTTLAEADRKSSFLSNVVIGSPGSDTNGGFPGSVPNSLANGHNHLGRTRSPSPLTQTKAPNGHAGQIRASNGDLHVETAGV